MNKNSDLNFIDRFLYKLLFVFILLFMVVALDKFNILSYNNIKKELSKQVNILEIVDKVVGDSTIFKVNYDYDTEVSLETLDLKKTDDGYLVNLSSYEAVEVLKCGVVVEIKENDGLYLVHVKGKDGLDYYYDNLRSINTHIYQVVEAKTIIGSANYSSNDNYNLEYFYKLSIYSDGERIDYYS